MSGGPSIPAPKPPADAPSWCVGLLRDIADWVHQVRRGPQALTGYLSAMRPSASGFGRSLIFDITNGIPLVSDDAGVWNNVLAYITAAASGNAATINARAGKLTSASLTTAAGAAQTLTITNTMVAAVDIVLCAMTNGTNAAGTPMLGQVTPGSGSFTAEVRNIHASAAFNGTISLSFLVLKA